MRRNLLALLLAASMVPMFTEAVNSDIFRVRSTAHLVEICWLLAEWHEVSL